MKTFTNPIDSVSRGRARWRGLRWGLRIAQVRVRFLLVLAGAFLIVGNWGAIRNYWDTLTISLAPRPLTGAVSADTEYFCPMCPGVLSEWPSKCSVCNMPLVRRQKGEAVQLPDGVLARMQLSPYRVQLAGIRTATVAYRPLVREIVAVGTVAAPGGERGGRDAHSEPSHWEAPIAIDAEIGERDVSFVSIGADAEVTSDIYPGHNGWVAVVSEIERRVSPRARSVAVRVAVDDPERKLWPGMRVKLRFQRPIAELEPFSLQPADPPALTPNDVRKVYTCPDHPEVVREKPGACPEDDNPLGVRILTDLERVAWWCPMHPKVTADEAGHECQQCNGMVLLPRIVSYRPLGEVLAVPESAVIDTGQLRVVYLERMPGMFDAVEVVLGRHCDGYYPVISGLEPGARVAAAGPFLIDAETRLNPSIAAGYFGAKQKDKR